MTGFGSAEDRVLSGRLRVEMRERLRQLLERGHVAVTARWVGGPGGDPERSVTVDLARAKQVLAAAQELKKKLKLKGTVDLAFVARHPDVLTAANGTSERPLTWADVQGIVERAARDVVAMREREGQTLATELNARLDALE